MQTLQVLATTLPMTFSLLSAVTVAGRFKGGIVHKLFTRSVCAEMDNAKPGPQLARTMPAKAVLQWDKLIHPFLFATIHCAASCVPEPRPP